VNSAKTREKAMLPLAFRL